MATPTASDEALLTNPVLQERIANLAKIGLNWTPPSQRPAPIKVENCHPGSPMYSEGWTPSPLPTSSAFPAGVKHPREKTTGPDILSEPESESEMMGPAYQDTIAEAKKKQDAHLASGPGTSRDEARTLDKLAFAELGLEEGEKSDKIEKFIPWRFLLRYPELYVGKRNTPLVEPYFQSDKLFSIQPWDFFYLYELEKLNNHQDDTDTILFVRTVQFEALLRKINRKHKINLTIPDGGNEVKFARQFPDPGPQPRFLCRKMPTSAIAFDHMVRCCPLPHPADDLCNFDPTVREGFNLAVQRCKDSWDRAQTNKGRNKSKKKGIARYDTRKAWGHASKRVQRWLGLRRKAASEISHAVFTGQETPAALPILDVNAAAPHSFDDDVVFVSFDVETDENSGGSTVTEIGFAILDTRDLKGIGPGENGANWLKLIQARHLRMKEYLHIKNHIYVSGCPDSFLFGKSEVVGYDRVERVCTEVLSPKDADGKPRKIVIVGHDIKQDIDLVFRLDVDIYELPGLIDIVDNQRIQQHDARSKDPQKLGTVLTSLGLESFYLHNGGNDAVYTLQSLIAVAVRRRQKALAGGPKVKIAPRSKPELGEEVGDEGWSTGGEDSDGGQPPKLEDPYEHLKDALTGTKGISSLMVNDDASKHLKDPVTGGISSQAIDGDAFKHLKGPITEGMSSLTVENNAYEQLEDPITSTEAVSRLTGDDDASEPPIKPTTATGGIWVNDDAFAPLNDSNTDTEGSSSLSINDDEK